MQISYHSALTKIQKLQNLKKKKKKKTFFSTGRYCPKLTGTANIFSSTKQKGYLYRFTGQYGIYRPQWPVRYGINFLGLYHGRPQILALISCPLIPSSLFIDNHGNIEGQLAFIGNFWGSFLVAFKCGTTFASYCGHASSFYWLDVQLCPSTFPHINFYLVLKNFSFSSSRYIRQASESLFLSYENSNLSIWLLSSIFYFMNLTI